MIMWLQRCHWFKIWFFLCHILSVLVVPTACIDSFCSERIYGDPTGADCLRALTTIPSLDQRPRYFVEQPLRTSPDQTDWKPFIDPRTGPFRHQSVQLPKFWDFGKDLLFQFRIRKIHIDRQKHADVKLRNLQYRINQLHRGYGGF